MIGPRHVNVVVFGGLALVAAAFLVTALAKARVRALDMGRENERRPRSIAAAGDPNRPDWFRYMDKNSDGKLSRKEFVGTDEQFGRIDTDGDRLISVREAWAADAWFRVEIPE